MTVTVTTTTGALRRVMTHAQSVARGYGTIPILSHALVTVGPSGARVETTDMDVWLHMDLPGAVSGVGAFTVAPKQVLAVLLDVLADDHPVELSAADGDPPDVRVTAGCIEFRGHSYPAQDFPRPREPSADAATVTVSAAQIVPMLKRLRHAISREETRYYLNGIYLHRAGDHLRCVATDGHRLMIEDLPAPAGLPEGGTIFPRYAARPLLALLDGAEGDLTIRLGIPPAKLITQVDGDGWTLTAKCIDGKYPEYDRVMPKPESLLATVEIHNPGLVAQILGALLGASSQSSQPVALRPGPDGDLTIAMHAENAGQGFAAVPAAVARWSGSPLPDGAGQFQARYLRDICEALPGGFQLSIAGDHGPALVTAEQGAVRGAIMPMRGSGTIADRKAA